MHKSNTDDTIEKFISDVEYQKYDLTKLIDKKNNILLVTHDDMDGAGCEMIVKKFCPNTFVINMKPAEVDKVFRTLDTSMFDCIIISDLCCTLDFVLNDPRVVIIDHHSSSKKYNNPVMNVFVNESVSATKLVYLFFRVLLDEDISYMGEFADVVDDYDTWKQKDPRSKILNFMFNTYGYRKFAKRFSKDFDPEVTDSELDKWYKEQERIEKTVENMPVFVRDYGYCRIGVIVNDEYMNEYCEGVMNDKDLDLDMVIYVWYPYGGSVRLNKKVNGINLGEILSDKLNIGGGHSHAAGYGAPDKTVAGNLEAIRSIIELFKDQCMNSDMEEINTVNVYEESISGMDELPF